MTSRRTLYSNPARSSVQNGETVNWQQMTAEQIFEATQSHVLPLYREAIALDGERNLRSARYGLYLGLISTGAARDEAITLLRELTDRDKSNALYAIDELLIMGDQSQAKTFEILRHVVDKVKFQREFLASAPPDIYPFLTNAQRTNAILARIVSLSYRALFRSISSMAGTSRDMRERKKILFLEADLAERFMKSNFLFDRSLGLEEESQALHQLLALAPYLTKIEATILRSKIARLEGMANHVKPETRSLLLHNGGLHILRFPTFGSGDVTISGPLVIVSERAVISGK